MFVYVRDFQLNVQYGYNIENFLKAIGSLFFDWGIVWKISVWLQVTGWLYEHFNIHALLAAVTASTVTKLTN